MKDSLSQRRRIALFYAIFAELFMSGIVLLGLGHLLVAYRAVAGRDQEQTPVALPVNFEFKDESVRLIAAVDALREAISAGRCVLFVDCDWNGDVAAFRQPFAEFAGRSEKGPDFQAISVKLDADNRNELWDAIQRLWQENAIDPGGLKNYGGAGRVVWFKDGRVVDHAWCDSIRNTDQMKARTDDAF